jgi:hypothetical protein
MVGERGSLIVGSVRTRSEVAQPLIQSAQEEFSGIKVALV